MMLEEVDESCSVVWVSDFKIRLNERFDVEGIIEEGVFRARCLMMRK